MSMGRAGNTASGEHPRASRELRRRGPAASMRAIMPATDWKETIGADEEQRFERLAEALRELQRARAHGGKPARALHAKAHAGLEAEVRVLPDLPEHARQGLFASPETYRAYVRFSNGSGARQSDGPLDVRGVAVKVVGVPGKKILPGLEDALTQDVLLIHAPATPFETPEEFVGFVVATRSQAMALPRLALRFGPVAAVRLLRRVVRRFGPGAASIPTQTYYGPAAVKFGPYAVRFSLMPIAPPTKLPQRPASPNFFGEDLADQLRQGPIEYALRVQFFVDEARTPIEDATVPWREEDAPVLTVARLVIPQQDMASPRGGRVAAFVEALSFDPWHALEAHRPLGAVMRARSAAYRISTKERGAAKEPDGTERFD
jgi:hypothetical protein